MTAHKRAVAEWQAGEGHRFEFAVEAAAVVGNYDEGATKQLARDIRRSVPTVQNYARAGKLWLELLHADSAKAETLRDELPISFWLPVASLYNRNVITRNLVWRLLNLAKGMTVEDFRSHLSTTYGDPKPEKPLAETAEADALEIERRFVNAPALGLTDKQFRDINRAGKLLAGKLRKVVK